MDKIAIVGAGPSGLAAAKYLLAEKRFKRIDIFEQRARVGGVWDYNPDSKTIPHDFAIPQTDPHAGLARPSWHNSGTKQALGNKVKNEARFMSPLYDHLETNIPRTLMGFSDLDWPQDSQLFPKHETVTQYIEDYAESVRHLIHFRTQVTDISPAHSQDRKRSRWLVKTKSVDRGHDDAENEEEYDAVVAASGHFAVPFIPTIPGLKEFSQRFPDAVSHSMYYKAPEEFTNKKVVCVGNGASGSDIATQIMTCCKSPLLQSQRSEAFLLSDPSSNKEDRPEIVEFITDKRAVKFADGSVEDNVDCILFCTGYFYSFPFLDHLDPPLIEDGTHVQNLYRHLFYRPNPTLVFPVLQQRIIPFPMAEVQAAVFSRVWSGRLDLPSDHEMKVWEVDQHMATGGGRDFHILKFPQDADYINAMHDFAMSADEGETKGKEPPRWGEKEYWLRERFAFIKKAFADKGQDRQHIRKVEELGYDFEEYKRENDLKNKTLI